MPADLSKRSPLAREPIAAPADLLAMLRRPAYPVPADGKLGATADTLLFKLMERAKLIRGALRSGMVGITCPWSRSAGYAAGHDDGSESSTVITGASSGHRVGGFLCLHGKCSGRTAQDMLALFSSPDPRFPDGPDWIAAADVDLDAAAIEPLSTSFRPRSNPASQSDDPAGARDGDPPSDAGGSAEPWSEPLPLDLLDVPRLPVDALPPVLANKVRDVARVTQTSADLAATAGLVVAASVGARRVDVAVGTTHVEPVNLYGAIISESGTRKGPAQRAMSAPLRAMEASLRAKAAPEIQGAQQRRRIAEKHIEHLSSQAAKESDPVEAQRLTGEAARLASELPHVPPLPTFIVGDRTPEKLEVDLAEQASTVLLEDEEAGTLFAIAGGRYSRDGSAQLDVYLKGYDRGALDTARITRERVICTTPELSICVTPQPFLMNQLRERPEFHHRGLLPRFLFSMPASNVGYRQYNEAAAYDSTVAAAYADMIERLADLPRWPDGAELPHLRIAGGALQVWKRYADRVERDCREGGRLYAIREWASKHPGRVARIAGTLHLVNLAASGRLTSTFPKDERLVDLPLMAALSITPRTVAAACRLGKYFEAHALAAYDCMAALPHVEGARRVLAWIRRTKQMRFSARDAFTALDRHFFRTMDDLIPCLVLLVEYHYIRWVPPPPRSGAGRPTSPVYEVSPRTLEHHSSRTPPPAAGNNSADTAEDAGSPRAEPEDAAPENGTRGFADTAEAAGANSRQPSTGKVAPERLRDAPRYTQNPSREPGSDDADGEEVEWSR
jgi:hypothetical protein